MSEPSFILEREDEELESVHQLNVNTKTREIYLHGELNYESDGEINYRVAINLIKNIHFLDRKNHDPIFIHMYSPGGNWEDGLAIYDALKTTKSKLYIIAHMTAASMSSIILQAADVRLLMPNCDFMIHWGQVSYNGIYEQVRSQFKLNDRYCEWMLDVYCSGILKVKQDRTKEQIKDWLVENLKENIDWYLPSNTAVDCGFADGIWGYGDYNMELIYEFEQTREKNKVEKGK